MGGLSAIDNFNRQISEAFRRLPEQIDEGVLTTMRSLPLEGDALHWNKETLLGPSSTWTFMINDNPMGDIFERLGRSIKRLTKQLLRL
jgi:preprotein translocase subunit SecA